MSTGAEFADHCPDGEDVRADEKYVRILFVGDQTNLSNEIRGTLVCAGRGSFEVIREADLVQAVALIGGDTFDLLLLDLSLPNLERTTAIELANDLANRLPVVVLTGTEAFDEGASPIRAGLKACVEQADLPGKLLSAIRRSRRLGTGIMTPVFCRIEDLCV